MNENSVDDQSKGGRSENVTAEVTLRWKRLVALHEAGHAFMVSYQRALFQNGLILKEVSIKGSMIERTPVDGTVFGGVREGDGGGYYLCVPLDATYLETVGKADHILRYVRNSIAAKMATEVFEDEFPLVYDDHLTAHIDYLRAHVRMAQFAIGEGVQDTGDLLQNVEATFDMLQEEVFSTLVLFKEALRELWVCLTEQEFMTGDTVDVIVWKHYQEYLERKKVADSGHSSHPQSGKRKPPKKFKLAGSRR